MSTTAIQRARPEQGPAQLAPVGWAAGRNMAYEEWLRHGSRLGVAGRNAAWWIGDWLRYGTACYGTKYAAAARVTGYDRQTLMNMVYVAGRFEYSRRRENLSWSHHAELAALDEHEQERWLDRVASERLTVRDLRDELASVPPGTRRRSRSRADARSAALHRGSHAASSSVRSRSGSARTLVCPQCGHSFSP